MSVSKFLERWSTRAEPVTAAEAVAGAVEADGYNYPGELESLRARVGKQQEVISILVGILHEKNLVSDDDIEAITGGSYERIRVG